MNIILNPFTNKIGLYRKGTKKEPGICLELNAKFSLNTPASCIHALTDFLRCEEFELLKKEKANLLVIPDYPVAFGTFALPALSRFKINDVFRTRFKSCYPGFDNYFVKYREFHRGEEESTYFYTFAKKQDVDGLVSLFENAGVHISGVDYFAHFVTAQLEKKDNYPAAFLLVGDSCSEFVLCKGSEVFALVSSNLGESTILNREAYLSSPYFVKNDRAMKYAAFMKESLLTKKALNDNEIDATKVVEPERSKPRVLRMLKGSSLGAYLAKNSAKKYLTFLSDLTDHFAHDPWFIPISEIKIISTDSFFYQFSDYSEDSFPFTLERASKMFDETVSLPVKANPLFKQTIKTERRHIDWSKFFSMSIGPKKKA